MFGDQPGEDERSVFAVEAKNNPKQAPLTEASVALIHGPYKLTHYFGYGGHNDVYELYDLTHDPDELENAYPAHESAAADLRGRLEERLRNVNNAYRARG
jgi:hypothetical protein